MATVGISQHAVNFNGLRKRPTYEELIDYIERDPDKIQYPDRRATFLRNSHYMTVLDGEGFREMEAQQMNLMKDQLRESRLREAAIHYEVPIAEVRAEEHNVRRAVNLGGRVRQAVASVVEGISSYAGLLFNRGYHHHFLVLIVQQQQVK
jgi:hypothetical protein